jgi:hypothetical protein
MSSDFVRFTAVLQLWRGAHPSGIHYVLIEGAGAEEIGGHELMRRLELGRGRGFGSVKVQVTVGASRWSTSVFPTREGGWFLPVKKPICRSEGIEEGDEIAVRLELL